MEIGDLVTWQASGKQMLGLFMASCNNNYSEVMCVQAGNVKMGIKCYVSTAMLMPL